MKQYFNLKDDVNINDLTMISPHLLIVFSFLVLYGERYNLPIKISSIIRKKKDGISQSTTHQSGRALDVSIAHFPQWTTLHIKRVVKKLNENYRSWGTMAEVGEVPRVAVYHKIQGGVPHLHLQVRRDLQLLAEDIK